MPSCCMHLTLPQSRTSQALVLTFLSYMLYHATRKPPSIVKSVLKGDQGAAPMAMGGHRLQSEVVTNYGWSPFNQEGGQVRGRGSFAAGCAGERRPSSALAAGAVERALAPSAPPASHRQNRKPQPTTLPCPSNRHCWVRWTLPFWAHMPSACSLRATWATAQTCAFSSAWAWWAAACL